MNGSYAPRAILFKGLYYHHKCFDAVRAEENIRPDQYGRIPPWERIPDNHFCPECLADIS